MTVTEILADVPAELDAETLRFAALWAIGSGMIAGQVLARSAGTEREIADKQLVGEIDYLTARGVTERVVSRVFRERDRRNPAYANYVYTEQDARETAMIYLAGGITAASLRATCSLRGDRKDRRQSAMVAAQMDKLLVEGFDPAAYMREIEQAHGGAR